MMKIMNLLQGLEMKLKKEIDGDSDLIFNATNSDI